MSCYKNCWNYRKFYSWSVCLCLLFADLNLQSQVYPPMDKAIYCQLVLGVLICIKHTQSSTLITGSANVLSAQGSTGYLEVRLSWRLTWNSASRAGQPLLFWMQILSGVKILVKIWCSRIPFLSISWTSDCDDPDGKLCQTDHPRGFATFCIDSYEQK